MFIFSQNRLSTILPDIPYPTVNERIARSSIWYRTIGNAGKEALSQLSGNLQVDFKSQSEHYKWFVAKKCSRPQRRNPPLCGPLSWSPSRRELGDQQVTYVRRSRPWPKTADAANCVQTGDGATIADLSAPRTRLQVIDYETIT
jgi:hypothetical protein